MIPLLPAKIGSVAVIGAHCDDIVIGAGATLAEITRQHPNVVVHALVLSGADGEREIEEKNALAAICPSADIRLTVADLPDSRLPDHWGQVKQRLATLRRDCEPDLVFGPSRTDYHQDHRLIAKLIPTEFRDHLVLGYEILKWESDLPNPTIYVPVSLDVAQQKVSVLAQCYPTQSAHDWFDGEAFLGLMRIRGVQCHTRYAEAFTLEKAVLAAGVTVSHN